MGLNDHMLNFDEPGATFENLPPNKLPKNDGLHTLVTPGSPSAIIRANSVDGRPADTTNMNQKELEQIGEWNAQIEIVTDQGKKLVNMQDVQRDIEGNNTIDSRDADEANATFEGLISPMNPLGGYTHNRSRTQFAYTQRFMEEKIQLTTEALLTDFRVIAQSGIGSLKEHLRILKDESFVEMRAKIRISADAIAETSALLMKPGQDPEIQEFLPAILPLSDGQFIDMVKDNLACVEFNGSRTHVALSDKTLVAINALQKLWTENEWVRSYVRSAHRLGDDQDMPAMTLKSLCICFSSNAKPTTEFLQRLEHDFSSLDEELDRLQTRANQATDSIVSVQGFLGDSGVALKTQGEFIYKLKAVVNIIAEAYEQTQTVFEGLVAVFTEK